MLLKLCWCNRIGDCFLYSWYNLFLRHYLGTFDLYTIICPGTWRTQYNILIVFFSEIHAITFNWFVFIFVQLQVNQTQLGLHYLVTQMLWKVLTPVSCIITCCNNVLLQVFILLIRVSTHNWILLIHSYTLWC